jgi:hypothetical protein
MGSRFGEEYFGKKSPFVTAEISSSGFLRLCTTDKYNTEQTNVELFLINSENNVMLDKM